MFSERWSPLVTLRSISGTVINAPGRKASRGNDVIKAIWFVKAKALQTQGYDSILAEYYDWFLRQLNDSRTAKSRYRERQVPSAYVKEL